MRKFATTPRIMAFLGAKDPERDECQRVLSQFGIPCAFALYPYATEKRPVEAGQAYDPLVTFREQIPESVGAFVFVECHVPTVLKEKAFWQDAQIVVCDHHNPGDAGFDMPPTDYLKGSSLGQLLSHLGIEPSAEQKLIAANDHCLSAAARGECGPDVDSMELFNFRNNQRARDRNKLVSEIESDVLLATQRLKTAPRLVVGSEEVAQLTADDFFKCRELATAAAWFENRGLGYSYQRVNPYNRTIKYGIMGVLPETVKAWVQEYPEKLGISPTRTYSCPARGYAGGYISL